jgi:hypothetical protein
MDTYILIAVISTLSHPIEMFATAAATGSEIKEPGIVSV